MKVTYRIPTEQYAYVEVETTVKEETTPETVLETHRVLTEAFKPKSGIPTKDFNQALDRYLKDGTGETEQFLAMNPDQQRVFQEIKKSLKRVNK